jgi:hypothetical protein
MNNRRQFIKKSLAFTVLSLFIPKLFDSDILVKKYDTITILDKITNKTNNYLVIKVKLN